jgi:hypothetical protein
MKKSSLEPLVSNPKSLLRALPGFLARAGPSAVSPTSASRGKADWGLQNCPTTSSTRPCEFLRPSIDLRQSRHIACCLSKCIRLFLDEILGKPGRQSVALQVQTQMSQLCLRWILENLQPIYYTLGTGDTSRSCEQSPMRPQPYLMKRSTKCVRLKAVATTQSKICFPCRLSRFHVHFQASIPLSP